MRFPIIHGMIKRRIFANFHLDPDTIPRILPDPFRNVPMIQLTCRSILCIGILTQAISVSANDAPSSRPTNMPRSVIASYNREAREAGEKLLQPELAKFLEEVAGLGSAAMYRGTWGERCIETV